MCVYVHSIDHSMYIFSFIMQCKDSNMYIFKLQFYFGYFNSIRHNGEHKRWQTICTQWSIVNSLFWPIMQLCVTNNRQNKEIVKFLHRMIQGTQSNLKYVPYMKLEIFEGQKFQGFQGFWPILKNKNLK